MHVVYIIHIKQDRVFHYFEQQLKKNIGTLLMGIIIKLDGQTDKLLG